MERDDQSLEGPTSPPSSELWGLKVYDTDGRLLGTIDSTARAVGGPMRAIVNTPHGPRRFALVDVSQATVRNGVVLVTSVAGGR